MSHAKKSSQAHISYELQSTNRIWRHVPIHKIVATRKGLFFVSSIPPQIVGWKKKVVCLCVRSINSFQIRTFFWSLLWISWWFLPMVQLFFFLYHSSFGKKTSLKLFVVPKNLAILGVLYILFIIYALNLIVKLWKLHTYILKAWSFWLTWNINDRSCYLY